MPDLLNSPSMVVLAAFFITMVIYVSVRKERIPSFIFLLFASLGAFFAVANIQRVTFLKAFVLFFFLIVLVLSNSPRRQGKPLLNMILMLTLISTVIVSGFLNQTPFSITRSYLGTMLIGLVVAFCPAEEKTLRYLLISVVLWGFVNLVASLFQLSGQGWMYRGDPLHTEFRMEGLMGTSTMMGVYFVLALNAVQALYPHARKRTWRITLFALGAGLFVGLLGTLSRAAVLAWIISFLFIQYKLYGMKLSGIIGIAAFAVAAIGLSSLINLDEIMLARLTAIKSDPSAQNRIPLIKMALEYLSTKPFFGTGLSQGGLQSKEVLVNTHNTFIQRLMENGIVGFAILMSLIIRVIKGFLFRTSEARGGAIDDYRMGFLAMLISVFVMGLFHDFSYLMPLWMVLGVGLMPWRKLANG